MRIIRRHLNEKQTGEVTSCGMTHLETSSVLFDVIVNPVCYALIGSSRTVMLPGDADMSH